VAYRDAKRDIKESNFARLIGVGGNTIRWTNVIIFAIAGAAVTAASLYLIPLAQAIIRFGPMLYWPGFLVNWHEMLSAFLFSIIETACAVIAFHKVRNEKWAAIVAATACTTLLPLSLMVDTLSLNLIKSFSFGAPYGGGLEVLRRAVQSFMYVSAELLGLVYAVKRFMPLAKALWIGELGGGVVGWLAASIGRILFGSFVEVFGSSLRLLITDLVRGLVRFLTIDIARFLFGLEGENLMALIISSLVFTIVFWAGTRMTAVFDHRAPESTYVTR